MHLGHTFFKSYPATTYIITLKIARTQSDMLGLSRSQLCQALFISHVLIKTEALKKLIAIWVSKSANTFLKTVVISHIILKLFTLFIETQKTNYSTRFGPRDKRVCILSKFYLIILRLCNFCHFNHRQFPCIILIKITVSVFTLFFTVSRYGHRRMILH